MNQSWIREAHSFKDYCTEVLYAGGKTNNDEFCHDTTGLPVVFQGPENSCVSCSITFVQQWIEKNHPNLSHEWLMLTSGTTPNGAYPKKVLEAARTVGICTQETWDNDRDNGYLDAGQHRIAGYAKSASLDLRHIGYLIEQCPIIVGVDNFMGKGPHMMAAVGFNLSKNVVKCANWWRLDRQDFVEFDASNISFACSILVDKPVDKPTMKILDVLKDKLSFIPNKLKLGVAAFGVAVLAFVGGYSGEQMFGAGYAPVTGYSSRTTSYVSAVATTIPVASTKDKAGNQITLANVSPSSTVRIYMNLEAGTAREELIACTGVTSVSWTNCTRGLTFQGSSTAASSTLAKAHNSGSNVIISNTGQFYGEYVSIDGAQNVYGVKTFYTFPVFSNTATLCTTDGQFCTKKYIDTVGAGGFTAANVSTTRGLSVDGSAPEKVGVKLTTGYGLRFLSSGSLVISTTTALTFSSLSATTTADGMHYSGFAGYNYSLMNRQSTDLRILQGSATGTVKLAAGVTAGRALWVSATSTLAQTDTSAASSTFQFVGVALETKSLGQTVRYARPGETACGLSGLVPGMSYYLNGSAGQLSTSPGAYFARIGRALTATCLEVMEPKYKATGKITLSASGYVTTTIGFFPASISLNGISSAGSPLSFTNQGEANTCIYFDGTPSWGSSDSFAYRLWGGATSYHWGTVTQQATSFSLRNTKYAGTPNAYVYYTVYSQ